jgi:predicted transcriptional regulator
MGVLTAKDIMTTDVLEANADWSVKRLTEFLVENSISGAPVISEKGKFIGVVTATDIIKNDTLNENDPESYGPHEYYLHSLENRYAKAEIASLTIGNEPLTTVADIMTPTVFSVAEDTPVQNVAEKMVKNRIHRIFVTRGGRIAGIISSVDMLKIIATM